MANKTQYRTTVYLGIVNGKKIRKTVRADTEKELNKKVVELKLNFNDKELIYSKAKFGEWADKWINEYKIPSGIGSGTITEYKSAIKHLNNYFEFTELKKITLSDFQKMINELTVNNPNTDKPMSKKSLENIIKVASAIFRYADSNNVPDVPRFFKEVIISK